MKKDKYLEFLLWGVVFYSIALLTYFTFKMIGHGAEFISAFGSILAATATFFAAYVAIKLYNDWREPALYGIKKENAYEVLKFVSSNYFYLLRIKEVLINISKVDRYQIISSSYLNNPSISRDKFFDKNSNIRILDKLFPSSNFVSIFANYERHISYIESSYLQIISQYKDYYKKILENAGNAEKLNILKQGDQFYRYSLNEKAPSEAFALLKTINKEIIFYVEELPERKEYTYSNFLIMLDETIDIHKKLEDLLIFSLYPKGGDSKPSPKEPSHKSPHSHSS